MTLKQAERMLDAFLEPLISALGFKRIRCLDYACPANEAVAQMSFPCRVDARGFVAFTCLVGIRFELFAQWLDEDSAQTHSTLASPIHFLRKDTRFTEWKFSGPDDLEELREPILADLTNHAMPFIEKYSRLDEVVKTVASPNPKDWFNWNVNSRVNFLAVARLIQGDKAGALQILDNALLERESAKPKDRFEIEYLRKRLVGLS